MGRATQPRRVNRYTLLGATTGSRWQAEIGIPDDRNMSDCGRGRGLADTSHVSVLPTHKRRSRFPGRDSETGKSRRCEEPLGRDQDRPFAGWQNPP